jgi:hypothetical protein
MNHRLFFKTKSFTAIVSALALNTFALAATPTPMTSAEYSAAKAVIAAEYKTEKAACASLSANAKDICMQEAKGRDRDGVAMLAYKRSGTARDAKKVSVARADSIFAIAKERCDDQTGSAKTLCRSEAKDKHTNALVDAKLVKTVSDATTNAIDDKRDADYKLASDKCEMMAGEARISCANAIKAQYKK